MRSLTFLFHMHAFTHTGKPLSVLRSSDPLPDLIPTPASSLGAAGGGAGTGGGIGGGGLGSHGPGASGLEGVVGSGTQDGLGGEGVDGEVGRLVQWSFAASSIVLALDIKGSLASLSSHVGTNFGNNLGSSGQLTGMLVLDAVFATALRFVNTLALQCSSAKDCTTGRGQHVYLSILAQGSFLMHAHPLTHTQTLNSQPTHTHTPRTHLSVWGF